MRIILLLQTIFRMKERRIPWILSGADSAGESTYSDALYPRDFEFVNEKPPFLHLHLPVLISSSGEDPSSYQGASHALARVLTSFFRVPA